MLVSPAIDRGFRWRAGFLFALVGLMWVIFAVETVVPPRLFVRGIVPRTSDGIAGIVVAPLFHLNLDHLVANTIPLLVLGAFILLDGLNEFLLVTILSVLVSGGGTWLFGAPHTYHIGASGVVFGYFGFLVFRSLYNRRLLHFVITIVVGVLYGWSMWMSLLPREGVSWSGHFFGLLGGLAAAKMLAQPRVPTRPSTIHIEH